MLFKGKLFRVLVFQLPLTNSSQCYAMSYIIALTFDTISNRQVESGVDELLFNLIILRSIVNSEGVVWQAQPTQYYIIECTPFSREVGGIALSNHAIFVTYSLGYLTLSGVKRWKHTDICSCP